MNTALSVSFLTVKAVCSLRPSVNPFLAAVTDWTLGGIVALMYGEFDFYSIYSLTIFDPACGGLDI